MLLKVTSDLMPMTKAEIREGLCCLNRGSLLRLALTRQILCGPTDVRYDYVCVSPSEGQSVPLDGGLMIK